MSKTVNEFQDKLEAFIKKELSPDIAMGFIGLIVLKDNEDCILFRVSTTFTQEDTEGLLAAASKSLFIIPKTIN